MQNRYFFYFFIFLLLSSAVSAEVIIFEKYETTTTLSDNELLVTRNMILKNVGKYPIIPGELHFQLYQMQDNKKVPLEVYDLEALRDGDKVIPSKVQEKDGATDMIVHVWDPLLPTFVYRFSISYKIKFDPSGVLFYEIQVPNEDTTIPIQQSVSSFVLPDKYSVTYAPHTQVEKEGEDVIVRWNDDDVGGQNVIIEYSRIPFPRIGIKAVNVFWICIILILLIVFIMSVMRSRRRLLEEL